MLKSKARISPISQNPTDFTPAAQALIYLPLLTLKNNQITVQQQGKQALIEQCTGLCYLVAVCGKPNALIPALYHSTNLPQSRANSSVYITSIPRTTPISTNTPLPLHIMYLDVQANNEEDASKLNAMLASICSIIAVGLEDGSQAGKEGYLTGIDGKIIYDKKEKDQKKNKQNRRIQTANLVFLKRQENVYSTSQIQGDQSELYTYLNRQHIYDQINDIYPHVSLMKLPRQSLYNSQFLPSFQQTLVTFLQAKPPNQLTASPVLVQYIDLAATSLNRRGIIDIQECKNKIQISEGYDGYSKSVDAYGRGLKKEIIEGSSYAHMKDILKSHREVAVDNYSKLSSDAFYLNKLNEFIDNKEQYLQIQNNKNQDLKNIAFLKTESDNLLNRISNQNFTQASLKNEIDSLVTRYDQQATGDNKYELLTNYLTILNPAAYKALKEKDQKIMKQQMDKYKSENKQLADRMRRMKEEADRKSGCCAGGGCTIM